MCTILMAEEGASCGEDIVCPEVKKMRSIFTRPDLVLVVEGVELYVDRTELCQESPVFQAMLNSGFEETNAGKIELPDKTLKEFLVFLRCTLSGIEDEITIANALTVIPLAREYQAQTTLKKAEKLLTDTCKNLGFRGQTSATIIEGIIFAEQYCLIDYLQALTDVASRKMLQYFFSSEGYEEISDKTIFAIAMKRWEDNIQPGSGEKMDDFSIDSVTADVK